MRKEKGAISLYALLAVMFFMAFMIGTYKIVSSRNSGQLSSVEYMQKQYYKTDAEMNTLYQRKSHTIQSYGELSTVAASTETWYMDCDLVVDMNATMCVSNFTSYDYVIFNGNVQRNNHNIIYTKDGKKYLLLAFQDIDKTLPTRAGLNLVFSGNVLSSITDIHTQGAYTNLNAIIGTKIDNGTFFKNTNGYEFLIMYPKGSSTTGYNITVETKGFATDFYRTWQQKVTPLSRTYDLNAIAFRDVTNKVGVTGGNPFQGITIPATEGNLDTCLFDGNIRNGTVAFDNWWYSLITFRRYDPVYIPGCNQRSRMGAFFIRVN